MRLPVAVTRLASALLLASCGSDAFGPGQPSLQATVRFVPIEGGCWILDAGGGKRYEPVGLPGAFRRDGLEVQAIVRLRTDLGSFCAVGQIVEVSSIRIR